MDKGIRKDNHRPYIRGNLLGRKTKTNDDIKLQVPDGKINNTDVMMAQYGQI